jgi:thymidine phosphorylase
VGLTVKARIGDKLEPDSPLATIHFNDAARAEEAAGDIRNAYKIGAERVEPPQLIKAALR